MLDILIGQIPEAIYFALFMIYAKNIKTKRVLFIILMVLEYVFLLHLMPYSIYPKIVYIVISYVIMKMLYKEKTQIIDIFVFILSVVILGFISVPLLFLNNIIGNIYITCIISKIIIFSLLFLFKNKLFTFYKVYYKHWNRNDKEKRKIKSLTVRNISVIAFNITFYLTNIIIIYVKLKYGR